MLEWTSKVNVWKPSPGSVLWAKSTIYSHCCSKSKRWKAMTGMKGKYQNNIIKAGRFYHLGFQIWAWWKWLNNRKNTDWLLQALQYNIFLILLLGRKQETSVGNNHPPAVILDKRASWCDRNRHFCLFSWEIHFYAIFVQVIAALKYTFCKRLEFLFLSETHQSRQVELAVPSSRLTQGYYFLGMRWIPHLCSTIGPKMW